VHELPVFHTDEAVLARKSLVEAAQVERALRE
jgi:hypothetical protein